MEWKQKFSTSSNNKSIEDTYIKNNNQSSDDDYLDIKTLNSF